MRAALARYADPAEKDRGERWTSASLTSTPRFAPPCASCAPAYPDAYWRDLDRTHALPDRVRARADRGRLAGGADPDEYGGAGLGITEAAIILEEINRTGGNAGRRARPDVHHGHAAAARLGRAEAALPAAHRARRAAPASLRRDRAGRRLRDHPPARRSPCARATATSSTARRCGSRAPSTRTCCCCWRAPRRTTSSPTRRAA